MISLVHAVSINGLESTVIDIEVDINNGLPAFTIVGLPDQGVQESKERLRSALKSSSARLSTTRITVNLAPANIKKVGPSFDLGIAVGILLNQGHITKDDFVKESLFLGELALDGKLRSVPGILPAVLGAKEIQIERFRELGLTSNSQMQSKDIKKFCYLTSDSEQILSRAVHTMDLSARSYYRILKLSRTIADLGGSANVTQQHILEALSYRKKEDY